MANYVNDNGGNSMLQNLRRARYERACWWLARRVDIVPLKPRSKELQPGYGSRKARITDVGFAHKWFLNTNANLGVVLGGDVDLVVGDWDDLSDYEVWRTTTGTRVETLTERTARGYHLFFLGKGLESAVGNGCELKTRGVCVVAPSVHPSGVIYCVLNEAPITAIDGRQACSLFPFLSETHSSKGGDVFGHSLTRSAPNQGTSVEAVGGGVIARIKAARSIVHEMSTAGVRLRSGGKSALVGLCPFHDDHSPSLWVNPESRLWGCNQPRCPAAGIHDVINFRALMQGIPNSAAIKQLADEFL